MPDLLAATFALPRLLTRRVVWNRQRGVHGSARASRHATASDKLFCFREVNHPSASSADDSSMRLGFHDGSCEFRSRDAGSGTLVQQARQAESASGLPVVLLFVVLVALPETVVASSHDFQECAQAAQFIRNAALARDAGTTTREAFLRRLEDDLMLIKSVPSEMRWFARDLSDEAFLRDAVRRVFDMPIAPRAHESEVLVGCSSHDVELGRERRSTR